MIQTKAPVMKSIKQENTKLDVIVNQSPVPNTLAARKAESRKLQMSSEVMLQSQQQINNFTQNERQTQDGYPVYMIKKIFNDNESTDESQISPELRSYRQVKKKDTILKKRHLTERLEDYQTFSFRDP